MTQRQMTEKIRDLGLTVRVRDGEIRVNLAGGAEKTAYYTNSREDAVETAKAMRQKCS